MIQRGMIREIDGEKILVGCGENAGCVNCSSTFCGGADETLFEVANPKRLEVATGDAVEIFLAPGKTIYAGFLVFVLPLALFAVAYLVASRFSASDALSAVAGIGGLALGFLLSLARKKRAPGNELPEIRTVFRNSPTPAPFD